MLLIIEGLDNTGKTTLIKQLRKTALIGPRTTSIHCSTPPNGVDQQWSIQHYESVLGLCRDMVKNGWDVILDRSHLGEDVFGPLFRNTEASYIYDIESRTLHDIDTKLVLLIDSPENLERRDDGQSHTVDRVQLQKISDRFVWAFYRSNIHDKMIYDVGELGFDKMLSTVVNFIGLE